jgi:hypothetical protein
MMVKKMEQDCAVGGEVLFVLSGRPDSNNTPSMGAGECIKKNSAVGGEVFYVLSGRPDSNNTPSMGAGECIKKTPLWEAKSFMC